MEDWKIVDRNKTPPVYECNHGCGRVMTEDAMRYALETTGDLPICVCRYRLTGYRTLPYARLMFMYREGDEFNETEY